MELGIQGRMNQMPISNRNQRNAVQLIQPGQSEAAKEAMAEAEKKQQQAMGVSREEMDKYIQRVLRDASLFNKDLRYSVNRETNEVIVKVVDKITNKVIKEIPPEALQRLQASLRKQIGLLLDEQI